MSRCRSTLTDPNLQACTPTRTRSAIRMSVWILLAMMASSAPLIAQPGPMRWDQNGHYYEYVPLTMSWDEAIADAESRNVMGVAGHLATVTSAAEQQFIFTNFVGPNPGSTPWLGGFQEPGAPEPDGGWRWITGEPFAYTAWGSTEPNNFYIGGHGPIPYASAECVLNFWENEIDRWNDLPRDPLCTNPGFIVEYPVATFLRADSNADGLVDVADPVHTLRVVFGGEPLICFDASDSSNDGSLDLSDATYTLNYLFVGGPPPSAPFPNCGAAVSTAGCPDSVCL